MWPYAVDVDISKVLYHYFHELKQNFTLLEEEEEKIYNWEIHDLKAIYNYEYI